MIIRKTLREQVVEILRHKILSGLIEPTYVEEAPTFVKKYVKNYFVSTVGQVDFSKVYIEK